MAIPMPAQMGDALILVTKRSFRTYAVGPVVTTGQQSFRSQPNVSYLADHAAAVAAARAVVAAKRKIFLLDIDTKVWSEVESA